jgi:hypothetical protein
VTEHALVQTGGAGARAMYAAMVELEIATAGHWTVSIDRRSDGCMEARVKATAYRRAYANVLIYGERELENLLSADLLAYRFIHRIDEVRRAITRDVEREPWSPFG